MSKESKSLTGLRGMHNLATIVDNILFYSNFKEVSRICLEELWLDVGEPIKNQMVIINTDVAQNTKTKEI